MKRICPILFSIILLAGCTKAFSVNMESIDSHWAKVTQGDEDAPILFISETDYGIWTHISDLNDRFQACRVPTSILTSKTTMALGQSILHYPMNYLILAYNYYDIPVRMFYEHSPLHRELVARPDAADVLVSIFEKTTIDKDPNLFVATSYEKITVCDELLLEYLLGSGLVKGLDKGAYKDRLKTAVTRKRDERLADEDLNGELTLIPLAYMSEHLGLGVSFSGGIMTAMHQFTMGDKLFDK